MLIVGTANANCDGERRVLARSDIQGETRLVWEKQLQSCLENAERMKVLEAKWEEEAKARAHAAADRKRVFEQKYNSFKEPVPGSDTYARDKYAQVLGRNKLIEEEFGEQCQSRWRDLNDPNNSITYDRFCLSRKGYTYETHLLDFYKKAADDEPALVAANKKARQEAARLAKLPGVKIGMSADQIIKGSNWGKPKSVNRTINSSGTHEQWVYGNGNYLYFTNGILTTIQN